MFVAICSGCHGPSDKGMDGLDKRFTTSAFIKGSTDKEINMLVKMGRPFWDAANTTGVDMPPKGGNPAMSDEYVIMSSGCHSGQVFVIGVPSMRLLKSIELFTPEPWQGNGYGVGDEILGEGNVFGNENRWGDTHHPALTETNGGPPSIRYGDSLCVECGMIVSAERFTAAIIIEGDRGNEPLLFDNFNCQMIFESKHTELTIVGATIMDQTSGYTWPTHGLSSPISSTRQWHQTSFR